MSQLVGRAEPTAVVERLRDATNAHDLEGIVACFAAEYRNETPLHPGRGFVGNDQVRRNWTQILAAIPDVSTEIVASLAEGATVWSEWEHRGTQPDGSVHLMRGVIVFGVHDGLIDTARFFLEPVDETDDNGVDAAVRRQVSPRTSRAAHVLVAGGSGRLGTLVVTALAARGVDVRVMTRDPQRAAHLAGAHVEVVRGDVRDPASTAGAVDGVDVVVFAVHGFAGPGGVSPASVDRDGNLHLNDSARTAGAQVVLMSGVGASADSPMELFRMKYAAETALAASAVSATIVRATAFLELWIDLLRRTAGRSNRPLVFGRGQNLINFVSVRDVAALVERVVTDQSTRGQTLQIGGPDNLTLDQLARMVAAHRGGATTPRHVPRAVLHTMAATVGRVRPELGRHAWAALAMDRDDMTFDDNAVRIRFADLPGTSAAELLT